MKNEERRTYWLAHIDAQKASGLTQAAYCAQHQLKKGTFGYWKTQFAPKASPSRLLPVTIQRSSNVAIYVPGGIRIEAPLDAISQLLPTILASVERAS